MPVSGLVVSLCHEPQLRAATLTQIAAQPHITMGVRENDRMALVIDTRTRDEDQRLFDWLRALPGVSWVEVAFIGFEEQEQTR